MVTEMMISSLFFLALSGTRIAAQQSAIIAVDWSSIVRPLITVVAFQTVVNPATCRESPYHAAVFDKIAHLGAPFQRYVPWLPYPRLGIVELEPPSTNSLCGFVNSGGAGVDAIWSTSLDCGAQGGGTIDAVVFANYGQPTGFCNALKTSPACSKDVSAIVSAECVGKSVCTLKSNDSTFGAAPCAAARLAIEVTCTNKAVKTYTYWNFEKPDEGMLDFLTAGNSSARSTIPNFSTIPNWMFGLPDRSYFPDDPLGETWGYEQGKTLRDATGTEIGDYYGRLVAHYVEGGFVDEGGRFIPGYNLTISHWEVLNEVNTEHGLSPQYYTQIYDWVVAGIKRWAPRGSAKMKFMGIAVNALEESDNMAYATYFLNASNHAPGIPVDAFSFHHYAFGSVRNGGVNGTAYERFFPSADAWITGVQKIQAVRAASSYPTAIMDADETGIILPDDNDAKFTALAPGFPALYWNAAAANLAYLFNEGAYIGLDVLGVSQLTGYPSIPFMRGPPINGPWTAPPQYPSVSMLSWGGAFGNPGDGTARYWMLKLLVDHFKATGMAGTYAAVDADVLMATTVTGTGAYASPFCANVANLSNMSLVCPEQGAVIDKVVIASYGTPSGSCGSWVVNASCSAAKSQQIVEGFCLGKQSCSFPVDTSTFGDPCSNVVKHLVLEATCSLGGGAQVLPSIISARAFVESAGKGAKKVLVVNKGSAAADVTLPGAAGALWSYIDESTAYGPALTTTLVSDTWTIAPFGFGLLRMRNH